MNTFVELFTSSYVFAIASMLLAVLVWFAFGCINMGIFEKMEEDNEILAISALILGPVFSIVAGIIFLYKVIWTLMWNIGYHYAYKPFEFLLEYAEAFGETQELTPKQVAEEWFAEIRAKEYESE